MSSGKPPRPVNFYDFLELYGNYGFSEPLRKMHDTCFNPPDDDLEYADTVCAAYIDFVEYQLLWDKIMCGNALTPCIPPHVREPWINVLYYADPEAGEIVEKMIDEVLNKYGYRDVVEHGETNWVLDDMSVRASRRILADLRERIINELEKRYLRGLGPGRYASVYMKRAQARRILNIPLPSPPTEELRSTYEEYLESRLERGQVTATRSRPTGRRVEPRRPARPPTMRPAVPEVPSSVRREIEELKSEVERFKETIEEIAEMQRFIVEFMKELNEKIKKLEK